MRFTLLDRGPAKAVQAHFDYSEVDRPAPGGTSRIIGELWSVGPYVVFLKNCTRPAKVFDTDSLDIAAELLEGEVAESPKEYLL